MGHPVCNQINLLLSYLCIKSKLEELRGRKDGSVMSHQFNLPLLSSVQCAVMLALERWIVFGLFLRISKSFQTFRRFHAQNLRSFNLFILNICLSYSLTILSLREKICKKRSKSYHVIKRSLFKG